MCTSGRKGCFVARRACNSASAFRGCDSREARMRMRRANAARVAAALMLATSSIRGQEPATQLPATPNTKLYAKIEQAVIKIHSVFGAPLHPVISGVGPGGGWGAGLGYDAPGRGPWDASAKAVYTWNG